MNGASCRAMVWMGCRWSEVSWLIAPDSRSMQNLADESGGQKVGLFGGVRCSNPFPANPEVSEMAGTGSILRKSRRALDFTTYYVFDLQIILQIHV